MSRSTPFIYTRSIYRSIQCPLAARPHQEDTKKKEPACCWLPSSRIDGPDLTLSRLSQPAPLQRRRLGPALRDPPVSSDRVPHWLPSARGSDGCKATRSVEPPRLSAQSTAVGDPDGAGAGPDRHTIATSSRPHWPFDRADAASPNSPSYPEGSSCGDVACLFHP